MEEYFYRFCCERTMERINDAHIIMARELNGSEPSTTAGVIDSHSVTTTEGGGPPAFDAGSKIKGRLAKIGYKTMQIIKRPGTATGFGLLPSMWVISRTFAWIGRCRRFGRGFEATIAGSTALCHLAHIRLLTGDSPPEIAKLPFRRTPI